MEILVTMIDKNNLIGQLDEMACVKLELGCGAAKRDPDAIGIDILDYDGVDIVGDIFDVLKKFPDRSVDKIYSSHFLEHIDDLSGLLSEFSRVMKKDGRLSILVPHFSNPYFYSDSTHKNFFGLYTLSYFSIDEVGLRRKVPTYQRELQFSLKVVKLHFQTTPSFYGRRVLKKMVGYLVNINTYTKELYEEMFCYLFPCYEIQYELRRI
jgi:SAM-dependent methyltransferase